MTDNEIIKALECCVNKQLCAFDEDKFYCHNGYSKFCDIALLRDALDLINRLQAENESKQELIERLQNANVQALRGTINVSKNIAKAEAYKEFAERLKEDISNHRTEMYMNGLKGTPRTREITYECVEEYIDNLLKELVGE